MTPITSPNSTLTAIQTKIRRLTASSSEQSLSTDSINEAINTFYQNDFPYAIKLDQLRSVYTFYTAPNVDRYPLNVNFNQGIRSPVYFEGVQGYFFKDRNQFFNMWPRWPTKSTQSPSTLSGTITAIANSGVGGPTIVTAANNLAPGDSVTIDNVVGMTQLNGNTYVISASTTTNFTIVVDSSGFGVYVSGGTYVSASALLNFTIQSTPFLSKEVVIGGTDTNGNAIRIADDGNGNLYYQAPNSVLSIPAITSTVPGMKNINTSNVWSSSLIQTYPGDNIQTLVGTVNYVTGVVAINLTLAGVSAKPGTTFNIWVSQYQVGRSYSMLFWNNEFTIRPVPDLTYKVEVETYMTPVQFINNTDNPLLLQWWQYIAYGAAMEIQRERNDTQGVESLREGFMRQEALVLERQGIEEINQRNATIFSSSTPQQGWNSGTGWPY